jgi:hypothetical protein
MAGPLRIKPHHFVDIIADYGAGEVATEPHEYGHGVHLATARILGEKDLGLRIELGADDICRPCKHNVEGRCDDTIDISFRPRAPQSKGEYNLLIDQRWCDLLRIKQGDEMTARELARRLGQVGEGLDVVYQEEPAAAVADRARDLRAGVDKYLALAR